MFGISRDRGLRPRGKGAWLGSCRRVWYAAVLGAQRTALQQCDSRAAAGEAGRTLTCLTATRIDCTVPHVQMGHWVPPSWHEAAGGGASTTVKSPAGQMPGLLLVAGKQQWHDTSKLTHSHPQKQHHTARHAHHRHLPRGQCGRDTRACARHHSSGSPCRSFGEPEARGGGKRQTTVNAHWLVKYDQLNEQDPCTDHYPFAVQSTSSRQQVYF